jgi:hypothetical protein
MSPKANRSTLEWDKCTPNFSTQEDRISRIFLLPASARLADQCGGRQGFDTELSPLLNPTERSAYIK